MRFVLPFFSNPIQRQNFLELLLPVLGFYFLDWSIVLIIAFYLADHLGEQISTFRVLLKIHADRKNAMKWMVTHSVSSLLFLILHLILLAKIFYQESLQNELVEKQLGDFLSTEIWIIIPLIVIASFLKTHLLIIVPHRFLQMNATKLVITVIAKNFIIFLFILIAFVLQINLTNNDGQILWALTTIQFCYLFLIAERIEKWIKNQ